MKRKKKLHPRRIHEINFKKRVIKMFGGTLPEYILAKWYEEKKK